MRINVNITAKFPLKRYTLEVKIADYIVEPVNADKFLDEIYRSANDILTNEFDYHAGLISHEDGLCANPSVEISLVYPSLPSSGTTTAVYSLSIEQIDEYLNDGIKHIDVSFI